jgi:hypothetical protein
MLLVCRSGSWDLVPTIAKDHNWWLALQAQLLFDKVVRRADCRRAKRSLDDPILHPLQEEILVL